MTRFLAIVACAIGLTIPISAQSDLDELMSRVLSRRDDNWKKLQQYVLEERETLDVNGTDGRRLYGYRREYLWFPQDRRFIKSPLTADGVSLSELERRHAEARWIAREEAREKQRADGGPDANRGRSSITFGPNGIDVNFESAMRDAMEPGFISAAYFLNFTFEQGQYALVGRETYEGRPVLRIEYYPTQMFKEGRTRPNKQLRERDGQVEAKMNKVSLVTLLADPAQDQIVKYEFSNIDFDFLPGRWFTRLEQITATMDMTQPFPDVWLPRTIAVGFEMSLATGHYTGRYRSEFHDYRLATVDTRVRGTP